MSKDSSDDHILETPPGAGKSRVCMKCGAWFALKLESEREDKLQGKISTYRCNECVATFEFAERHPPDAI